MSKKTRTILFLICLFLFLSITPLVILYSQGYRFDLNPPDGGIKITQTGGIFIKTEPKQAEIYIDNELIKRTDFFFGSALVENLLPKRYKIEIKKENYLTWEKNLEIREKEVTEIKNIILFPKNMILDSLIFNQEGNTIINNFWFSPDKKKMVLLEKDNSFSPPSLPKENPELEENNSESEKNEKAWALKLYDLERNIKSHLISEADIYKQGADLINLEFSDDSKDIYLDVEIVKELSQPGTFSSSPENQKKTFILKLDKLPLQLSEKEIIPLPENIITLKKYNQDTYYLDNSGYFLKNELKMNEIPLPIEPEINYSFEIFSDYIFLITAKSSGPSLQSIIRSPASRQRNLYLFSTESKSFELFFERINGLEISPEKRKMAFFSDSEVWVLFLKDEGIKKAGDKLFISRLSERIDNVVWLNSDYLIFNSGNNLKIAELDDRDRIQVWDINTSPNFDTEMKIYFNQDNKKLYILNKGSLFISQKIF